MSEGLVMPPWWPTEEDLEREERELKERLVQFFEGVAKLPVNADGSVTIRIVRR